MISNEYQVEIKEIPIKINPQYEKYSYDPALIHFHTIRDSIRDNGQYNKITINEKGIILDGHKRFKVCKELDISPQTKIKSFDTVEQEEEFVIDCNLARTHYTTYEKVESCEKLLPIIKKQAEQRQRLGKKLTFTQNYVKVNAHQYETDSILSRKAGISASTYRKYRAIINSDDGQLKDDVKSGKISVSTACNILKKYSQKIEPSKILKNEYGNVIVANPKWTNSVHSSINASDYPHIIKSCSHENAILVLGVSNKHMQFAFNLIQGSGFEYHRTHTECNKKSSKFIIVAKRGNITIPDLEFSSDKKIHEVIENAFPSQKYVELWTDKSYSDKWSIWDETVTVSIPENIPEHRRPMQTTIAEHFGDLGV
jgi:hypothetical protein